MVDNDYRQPGKTIAELHDLEEVDPWQSLEISELKKLMDEQAAQEKELLDEMFKRGMIPSPVPPPSEPQDELVPEFQDPDDDEDPTILGESSLTLFWRLNVPNKRLKEIVDLDPDLVKIVLNAKNTSAGCWFAFTGQKIANRVANALNNQGIFTSIDTCDIKGNQIELDIFVDQVTISEWRPWKPIGPQIDVILKPEEFFYCINQEGRNARACFVPETYWNEHRKVFDGALGIDVLLHGFDPVEGKPYSYQSWRDLNEAKAMLNRVGFRENMIFHAYVNEEIL